MQHENGYPIYPIYHVSLKWLKQDGTPNGTSGDVMLREPNATEINRVAFAWLKQAVEKDGVDPTSIDVTIELKLWEEWCLTWFSHYTFDIGQSDAEALESFEDYVCRTMAYNRRNQIRVEMEGGDFFYRDPICLMGAEDRWRWTARADGTSMIGCGESSGTAPCRCEACREAGVLRVDH